MTALRRVAGRFRFPPQRPHRFIACLLIGASLGSPARAWQEAPSAAAPAPSQAAPTCQPSDADDGPLPGQVRDALVAIQDFSFSYAQPGFYALLEYMRADPDFDPAAGRGGAAGMPLTDWRILLERPADFRGRPVCIEGVVRRSTAWRHQQPQYAALGTLWELQLSRRDQPLVCKLLLTEPAVDVPLGATLRVTGIFTTIQHYYSETHQLRQAAVLVARGPSQIAVAAKPPSSELGDWSRAGGLLAAGIAGLTLVWLLLRRSTARPLDGSAPHATQTPGISLADQLQTWAETEQVGREVVEKHERSGTDDRSDAPEARS